MRGGWYKKLHKQQHFSKKARKEHNASFNSVWRKYERQVRKLVTKLHKKMNSSEHTNGGGGDMCTFWWDVNDGGGYRECCELCGGICDSRGCPYTLVQELYDMLNGR